MGLPTCYVLRATYELVQYASTARIIATSIICGSQKTMAAQEMQ